MFNRDMYDELFSNPKSVDIECGCKHNYLVIGGSYTCILCGIIDPHKTAFSESLQRPFYRSYFIYHRKSYFMEKLNLMVCIKQSLSDDYPAVVQFLKSQNFNTIFELKKLMRKYGYHKFYRYIYSIFYEIKGLKLIKLSLSQINFLTHEFLKLEHYFKREHPNKNSLLSYNVVIYLLLKKYNHESYKYILLPKNYRKIVKFITEILKFSEI